MSQPVLRCTLPLHTANSIRFRPFHVFTAPTYVNFYFTVLVLTFLSILAPFERNFHYFLISPSILSVSFCSFVCWRIVVMSTQKTFTEVCVIRIPYLLPLGSFYPSCIGNPNIKVFCAWYISSKMNLIDYVR